MGNSVRRCLRPIVCGFLFFVLSGCNDDNTPNPEPPGIYYKDGESVTYQKATVGNGVSLVFLGDGFTKTTLKRENGAYMALLASAAEHFFDIEPYKSYRDYFNVYFVAAVSEESGISSLTETVSTCFSTQYTGSGSSTAMETDFEKCFEYALKSPMVPYTKGIEKYAQSVWNNYKCRQTLIVVVANSSRYGGTTQLYSTNTAVAICPNSNTNGQYRNFRGLVQHEAGGHGFGKLTDEYTTREGPPSAAYRKEFATWTQNGFFANADTTNDRSLIKWRHFYNEANYSEVGAWEGSDLFRHGMWRPEEESCMDVNLPYFNAPSREEIVQRIFEYAGMTFDFDAFLQNDKKTVSVSAAARPDAASAPGDDGPRPAAPRLVRIDPIAP